MVQFFETRMGQRFYGSTMPRIADALEKIAEHLDGKAEKLEPEDDKESDNSEEDQGGVSEQ